MAQEPDGAVDRGLSRLLGRSWKTSLAGAVTLVCGVLAVIPGVPPIVHQVCGVIVPIVAGGGLMVAKDFNKSHSKR